MVCLYTKENIPIKQLVSGGSLTIPVFRFKGQGKGPVTYIQANVHGAEVQGNAVIYELMRYLQQYPPQGDFILVPQANPFGANQKFGEYTVGRFDPTTGTNWNRAYWYGTCLDEASRKDPDQINLEQFTKHHEKDPWEEIKRKFKKALNQGIQRRLLKKNFYGMDASNMLSLTLQSLSCQADIVLDLHTGPISTRYIYLPEYALPSAKYFNIPHMLVMPHQFEGAMDEASFCPWWDLQKSFAALGRKISMDFESYTLEHGGQERIDFNEAKSDCQNMIQYLKFKGAVNSKFPDLIKVEQAELYACKLKNYEGLYSPMGGLVEFKIAPGQLVKKGDLLCQILNYNNITDDQNLEKGVTGLRALEDSLIINHFPTASVHEGTELMRFFTQFGRVQREEKKTLKKLPVKKVIDKNSKVKRKGKGSTLGRAKPSALHQKKK